MASAGLSSCGYRIWGTGVSSVDRWAVVLVVKFLECSVGTLSIAELLDSSVHIAELLDSSVHIAAYEPFLAYVLF